MAAGGRFSRGVLEASSGNEKVESFRNTIRNTIHNTEAITSHR